MPAAPLPAPSTSSLDHQVAIMNREEPSSRTLTSETSKEETWAALRQFYAKNRGSIERFKAFNFGHGRFQEHLDQILETSQVLLDGLIALANVHPAIGVAVFAFHGIIKLDITRRENNRKVLSVMMQMQSMMSAMFQLCELKHVHVLDSEQKASQRAQFQALLKTIADEIIQCGSDLNYYSDRKFVSKLIKAKIYERRFAEHVETFALRRSELQSTITAYISAGAEATNVAVGHVGQKVEVMAEKIDALLAVFQRLDTPSEREVLKFIEDNGGAESCISQDETLRALLVKSGQSSQSETLADSRKALKAELSEDMDQILSRNLSRFERLLVVQNNNIERLSSQIERQSFSLSDHGVKLDLLLTTSVSLLEEGKLIKKAIVPNTSIRLEDPELQQIWEGMGLSNRRSVKAKHFVPMLRDYLINGERSIPPIPGLRSAPLHDSEDAPPHFSLPTDQITIAADVDSTKSDVWVLKYINVANMQPVIEAMDDDGSGYISVQEANEFALSRPKGMPLLHWFAYWAAGWRCNISDYRNKIYKIMQQLHIFSEPVLASNRKLCALYLDDWDYFRIEGILRHIASPASGVPRDPKLVQVAAAVAVAQEERLKKNLEELSYLLLSPADVALVIGDGRLEHWLLPLLYLLLSRHRDIFSIAWSRTLDSQELEDHSSSIETIVLVYEARMRQLRDIFQAVGHDPGTRFTKFAYGMFGDAYTYTWTGLKNALGNTLLDFFVDGLPSSLTAPRLDVTCDTNILVYGPGNGLDLAAIDLDSALRSQVEERTGCGPAEDYDNTPLKKDSPPFRIEGRWVGSFTGGVIPPFECIIHSLVDGKFDAKARDFRNLIALSGLLDIRTGDISIYLRHSIGFDSVRLSGTYDCSRDVIHGWWARTDKFEGIAQAAHGDSPKDPHQTFSMTRQTISSFRFRHLLDVEQGAPEMSIARRRWTFATQTALFDVQDRLGSWEFMRRRVAERNDWIKLYTRRFPPDDLDITRGLLNDDELARLEELRRIIHPTILAIYHSIQRYWKERQAYDAGNLLCDVCDQSILFEQYMCITCVEEDYSDSINFCVDGGNCSECVHMPDSLDFPHNSSHTLLRTSERIYAYEMPTVVSQARTVAESVKRMFRQSTTGLGQLPETHPVCTCCRELLTLPCWACVICARSNYIFCLQCEKNLSIPLNPRGAIPNGHSRRHHLLRIRGSVEEKPLKRNSQDAQMHGIEAKFDGRLRDLEEKLEQKLDSRMSALETKVDLLTSLIHQMLQSGEKDKEV